MADSILHKISGCENKSRSGDVVFVHGLGGDAIKTWHHNEKAIDKKEIPSDFWLSWLGRERDDLGIWSLGYALAPFASQGETMPLIDRARNVLSRFGNYKLGERPLIFVAHSMGGLLVKQMLRQAADQQEQSWQQVRLNTRGIIFIATPHFGSQLANSIEKLGKILPSSVSVNELMPNNPYLRDLNDWYRDNCESIPIKIYFEKYKTTNNKLSWFKTLVVDETSSNPGITGVRPIPIDADHLSICRPENEERQIYMETRDFLEKHLSSCSSVPHSASTELKHNGQLLKLLTKNPF